MMFKMNQLAVGLFLFLSSLFSCQQKGDFESMNVEDFDALIQDEGMQRLLALPCRIIEYDRIAVKYVFEAYSRL